MKPYQRMLSLFLSIVVLTLLASLSLAGPGGIAHRGRSSYVITRAEAEACEQPIEGEECVADEDETTEGDVATDDDSAPAEAEAGEREAACMEAAGVNASVKEKDGETESSGKAHGLDNAVERVLTNCVKNPQAPGLLNALGRLVANRERHEAHEAWKAERKAERDAAKADQNAGNGGGNGGSRNDHSQGGNSDGNGGGGGDPGNTHGNGSGGSHGNGHSN